MDGHGSDHEDDYDVPAGYWESGSQSAGHEAADHDSSEWLTDDPHAAWSHEHDDEPAVDLGHGSDFDSHLAPHAEDAPSHAADYPAPDAAHDSAHDSADLSTDHEPAPEHPEPADAPEPGDQPGDPAPPEPAWGADPDLPAAWHSSDAWLDLPDVAHLDLPEPSGGGPWIDTAFLGAHSPSYSPDVPSSPATVLADLRAALGEPPAASASDAAFEQLLVSDDPAVRALAHLWRP